MPTVKNPLPEALLTTLETLLIGEEKAADGGGEHCNTLLSGENENGSQTEAALDVKVPTQIAGSEKDIVQADMVEPKVGMDASREEVPQKFHHAGDVNMEAAITSDDVLDASREEVPQKFHHAGDVNMEAAITSDDVLRAGGFGARDDLNSFLPAASDSTDFEASLLDARDYEEPQGEPRRPGLGWTEATESE